MRPVHRARLNLSISVGANSELVPATQGFVAAATAAAAAVTLAKMFG